MGISNNLRLVVGQALPIELHAVKQSDTQLVYQEIITCHQGDISDALDCQMRAFIYWMSKTNIARVVIGKHKAKLTDIRLLGLLRQPHGNAFWDDQ
ncbi:hypothetical protein SAMN05421882_100739 [Nitrosomonas communis]|uniref:Uncharacterized protein n=1 Tax=Nitrosomonas communis TaxID=44574 RepID=A0A1H2SHN3_9PROT|nr:hypothetical protein SAMN05421882_100739 [Nitrosomonas communis]